jgi:hypothetical protein
MEQHNIVHARKYHENWEIIAAMTDYCIQTQAAIASKFHVNQHHDNPKGSRQNAG